MCLGDTSNLAFHGKRLKSNSVLQNKLVLHRGWHCLENTYVNRPLENTRQAYVDSVKAGARFAECDVWVTKDGILVLNHNSSFAAVAAEPDDRLATLPISSLDWDELCGLELQDGSTPVKLDTVLEDLLGTELRLVIELKTSSAASRLGAHLASCPDLVCGVAWVMSFSLATLELFVEDGGRQAGCHSVWLLGNPREAYEQEELDEGEIAWNYASESLTAFLDRVGAKKCFQHLQCGLYLQYHPCAMPAHIQRARAEMNLLVPDAAQQPFIGLWSDARLDASFDRVEAVTPWLDVFDVINTDLPREFWLRTPDLTGVEPLGIPAECDGKARTFSWTSTDCASSRSSVTSTNCASPRSSITSTDWRSTAQEPWAAAQDLALPLDFAVTVAA